MTTKQSAPTMTAATFTGGTFWRYGRGPDAFGFQPGTVSFEVPGAFDVSVVIDVDRSTQRPEASSVTITRRADGPAIGSRSVASEAKLGGLVRLAVEQLSFHAPSGRASEVIRRRTVDRASQEQLRRLFAHDKGGAKSDAAERAKMIRKAATAYRRAQRSGRPTTRAVQDACHVSSSLARKLVSEARSDSYNLLPEAGGTTRPKLD